MSPLFIKDMLSDLNSISIEGRQSNFGFTEWMSFNLTAMVKEFIAENASSISPFIKRMNKTFKTARFEPMMHKWILSYLYRLFYILDSITAHKTGPDRELVLYGNPLNRFAIEKYRVKHGNSIRIRWQKEPAALFRIFNIFHRMLVIVYCGLNAGLRVCSKKKKYKVMREAVWGLYGTGGYHFHDDFMVDGDKIKKDDLILFSRGIPIEAGRLKGYFDAKSSPYAFFDIMTLPIDLNHFFSRVVFKYIISGASALFSEISSTNFTLCWSVYLHFIYNALPYEKLFSNFEIASELGHQYFSVGHIPEAIVCENHGARYYLMHWSDHSTPFNKFLLSFMACDGFFSWGKAYIRGAEHYPENLILTGYFFKGFIKEMANSRERIFKEMGINPRGKIITFFDETFGNQCPMTEEVYVAFWETALRFAEREPRNTILIKAKGRIYDRLSGGRREKFDDIKNKMEKMLNISVFDSDRWSFIEFIGISDIVVTQGMTTSATIAIICGIEGLYLDAIGAPHPFRRLFKDRLVFDEPSELLSILEKIVNSGDSPLKGIPEEMLRDYDAYPDDRGIDRLRDVLLNGVKAGNN